MTNSISLLRRPMFWLGLGLLLACVVLLVGGLVFDWRTPNAGFMKYCPEEHQTHLKSMGTGEVFYVYTGDGPNDINGDQACQKPAPVGLTKSRMPWRVGVTTAELEGDVMDALGGFNRRAGCTLFAFSKDPTSADVVISRDAATSGDGAIHPGGTTTHTLIKGKWEATIRIYNLVLSDEMHRGLLHELGHAAGLAHDDFKDSLMYSGTSGSEYLTHEDQDLLQQRYCP